MSRTNFVKGPRQSRKIDALQRQGALQIYALTENKAETCRRLGIARETLNSIIKGASNKDLEDARRTTSQQLEGKIHEKAEMIIDSITEADLKKANLMQKTTAAAILTDKKVALGNMIRASRQETADLSANRMIPQDVNSLIAAIKNKVSSIDVLRVQFRDDSATELTAKANRLLEEAAQVELSRQAAVEVIDLDRP